LTPTGKSRLHMGMPALIARQRDIVFYTAKRTKNTGFCFVILLARRCELRQSI
jgi:hypothetical protein